MPDTFPKKQLKASRGTNLLSIVGSDTSSLATDLSQVFSGTVQALTALKQETDTLHSQQATQQFWQSWQQHFAQIQTQGVGGDPTAYLKEFARFKKEAVSVGTSSDISSKALRISKNTVDAQTLNYTQQLRSMGVAQYQKELKTSLEQSSRNYQTQFKVNGSTDLGYEEALNSFAVDLSLYKLISPDQKASAARQFDIQLSSFKYYEDVKRAGGLTPENAKNIRNGTFKSVAAVGADPAKLEQISNYAIQQGLATFDLNNKADAEAVKEEFRSAQRVYGELMSAASSEDTVKQSALMEYSRLTMSPDVYSWFVDAVSKASEQVTNPHTYSQAVADINTGTVQSMQELIAWYGSEVSSNDYSKLSKILNLPTNKAAESTSKAIYNLMATLGGGSSGTKYNYPSDGINSFGATTVKQLQADFHLAEAEAYKRSGGFRPPLAFYEKYTQKLQTDIREEQISKITSYRNNIAAQLAQESPDSEQYARFKQVLNKVDARLQSLQGNMETYTKLDYSEKVSPPPHKDKSVSTTDVRDLLQTSNRLNLPIEGLPKGVGLNDSFDFAVEQNDAGQTVIKVIREVSSFSKFTRGASRLGIGVLEGTFNSSKEALATLVELAEKTKLDPEGKSFVASEKEGEAVSQVLSEEELALAETLGVAVQKEGAEATPITAETIRKVKSPFQQDPQFSDNLSGTVGKFIGEIIPNLAIAGSALKGVSLLKGVTSKSPAIQQIAAVSGAEYLGSFFTANPDDGAGLKTLLEVAGATPSQADSWFEEALWAAADTEGKSRLRQKMEVAGLDATLAGVLDSLYLGFRSYMKSNKVTTALSERRASIGPSVSREGLRGEGLRGEVLRGEGLLGEITEDPFWIPTEGLVPYRPSFRYVYTARDRLLESYETGVDFNYMLGFDNVESANPIVRSLALPNIHHTSTGVSSTIGALPVGTGTFIKGVN